VSAASSQASALPLRWPSPLGHPLLAALAALPLLLAWDASNLDWWLAQSLAGPGGFALREHPLLVLGLHQGGRMAAALALATQAVHAALPVRAGTPRRAQRLLWLVMTLVGWAVVSLLKSKSPTSCPWDLAAFGGVADYVGHWAVWRGGGIDGGGGLGRGIGGVGGFGDGGPGRCFPSGHAVAGFGFFSLAFLWRHAAPRRAARLGAAALVAGLVLGAAQVLRGAHFASHVLWAGWCCWLVCAAVATAVDARFSAARPAAA